MKISVFFYTALSVLFFWSSGVNAAESYGSADLNLIYRLHPLIVFYWLGPGVGFINRDNLVQNRKSIDIEHLYYLRNELCEKIREKNSQLKNDYENLNQEKRMLEMEMYRATDSFSSSLQSNAKQDEQFLKKRQETQQKLAAVIDKMEEIDKKYASLFLIPAEKEQNIRSEINKSITEVMQAVKKKSGIERFIICPVPGKTVSPGRKADVIKFCFADKKEFTRDERIVFELFMKHGMSVSYGFNSRTDLIVYGGRDYTSDMILELYRKYQATSKTISFIEKLLIPEENAR